MHCLCECMRRIINRRCHSRTRCLTEPSAEQKLNLLSFFLPRFLHSALALFCRCLLPKFAEIGKGCFYYHQHEMVWIIGAAGFGWVCDVCGDMPDGGLRHV